MMQEYQLLDVKTGQITTVFVDEPAPVVVPVIPDRCSPLQMRRALRQMGYKAAVDAYIAQQTEEVQEAWEYATVIERSDPLMADAISLLSAQLSIDAQATGDALFTLAVTL